MAVPNALMPGTWQSLKDSLPVGLSEDDKRRRVELWRKFNIRNPKSLVLFEVEAGIQKVLGCEELFNAKAVIMRAYNYAREINPKGSPQRIEFCEFRLLLVYLKGFFSVFQVFTAMDKSKDRLLSLEEITAAAPELAAIGVPVNDPEMLWRRLKGTNEFVDFHEFSDWAIREGLAGAELLDRAEALDTEAAEALSTALRGWDLCRDGAIAVEDLKALLKLVSPAWTDQDGEKLFQMHSLPIVDGKIKGDAFVEFLCHSR